MRSLLFVPADSAKKLDKAMKRRPMLRKSKPVLSVERSNATRLLPDQCYSRFCSSWGSMAMLTAMRRASSRANGFYRFTLILVVHGAFSYRTPLMVQGGGQYCGFTSASKRASVAA
jgi:hypothetical protein